MSGAGADCVYWMNRYIERAENISRFIEAVRHREGGAETGAPPVWGPLVLALGDVDSFVGRYGEPTRENVVRYLTFDAENPNSIVSCWRTGLERACLAREVISSDMWSEVNEFCGYSNGQASTRAKDQSPDRFLREVKRAGHLLEGISNATVNQGPAWHFGRVGRLLERADMTVRMIHVRCFMATALSVNGAGIESDMHWTSVLRAAGAFEMYGYRHRAVTLSQAADFLICDLEFPRSIRNCLRRANESLHAVTSTPVRTFQNVAQQRLGRLVSEVDYADMTDLAPERLRDFLHGLQTRLGDIGDAVQEVLSSATDRVPAPVHPSPTPLPNNAGIRRSFQPGPVAA